MRRIGVAAALLSSAMLGCGGKFDGPGRPSGSNKPPMPQVPPSSTSVAPASSASSAGSQQPATQNPGGTIAFEPTLVLASRLSNVCGDMPPPFMNGDSYFLGVTGDMTNTPYNGLSVKFRSPAPVGVPITLVVQPVTVGAIGIPQPDGATPSYGYQSAQGGGITFDYSLGHNPNEIDSGAFDSVSIVILAMPSKEGEPLTIRVQAHFVDGKVLDETFSSPISSSYSPCVDGMTMTVPV